jgi:hypothetical protein
LAKANGTQRVPQTGETGVPGARDPPAWRTREGQQGIVRLIIDLTDDGKSERTWEVVVATLCQTEDGHHALLGAYQMLKSKPHRDWPQRPGAELNKALRNYISTLGLPLVSRYGEVKVADPEGA